MRYKLLISFLLLPTAALAWEQDCKWNKAQCAAFLEECVNASYATLDKDSRMHGDMGCGCVAEELSKIMNYGKAASEHGNKALLNGIGIKCNTNYLNSLE